MRAGGERRVGRWGRPAGGERRAEGHGGRDGGGRHGKDEGDASLRRPWARAGEIWTIFGAPLDSDFALLVTLGSEKRLEAGHSIGITAFLGSV